MEKEFYTESSEDTDRRQSKRDRLGSLSRCMETGEVTARLLLCGGFGGFDLGGGVGVLFGEAFDAAGGVNQLLFAGEERMAIGADFDVELLAFDGRASLEIVAAGAVNGYGVIVGVNTGFHEAPFVRVRSARRPGYPGKSLTRVVVSYSRVARSRGKPLLYVEVAKIQNTRARADWVIQSSTQERHRNRAGSGLCFSFEIPMLRGW
jgi:hypothetical protein